MRWYARNHKLAAKHAALEREGTALLRADARRQRAVRQAKPRPKPKPPPPSPLPPVSGWMPLADLQRALRAKEFRRRARRQ